jgi:glycerol-3-phosphate cytidylyltransferase-like family protein
VDFQLKFKDATVDSSNTIRSFMAPNDDLVLFRACLSDQPPSQTESPTQEQLDITREVSLRSAVASNAVCTKPCLDKHLKDEPQDDHGIIPQTHSPALSETSIAQDTVSESGPSPTAVIRTVPELYFNKSQLVANPPELSNSDLFSPTHRGHVQSPSTPTPVDVSAPSDIEVKAERRPSPIFPHMDEDTQITFNPENYFNREFTAENDSQEHVKPIDQSIREVVAQQDPRMLEAGVAKSMIILQELKRCFSRYLESIPDALAWTEAIDKLIPQAQRKRTIVGVVGNTGAGKSSVINAMLDEERLVPTNCMRACTAVVTEMSWNDSTDPVAKYRAEVDFISHDDWQREVATLMKEFLTESGGVSREVSDENSDAGIAWAKFHSVYPKKTRDSLSECTVESLMSEKAVLAVLGTTKKITTATPHTFSRQLQRYVDSKEKVSKKGKGKDTDSHKKTFDMEYWPLIKVVKIYVKSPALSTGAVIVDLPGVHDSNAARAAVAQGYMKQCTGLWIVAPINRAVDDKAAKTLLGESFKRQLKYDGGFSSVTFICSKTDDISITEALDTLGLNDDVEDLYKQQRLSEQEIKAIKKKIEILREAQAVYKKTQAEASEDMEVWEQLRERLDDGKLAFAPKKKSNKRKVTHSKQKEAHKKRRTDRADTEDDFIVSDEEGASSENETDSGDEDIEAPRVRLTEDDIKIRLKEIRETNRAARREAFEISEKINELQPQTRKLKEKIAAIQAEISHICIAGRNDYSKRAIQQDFAAGLKELDQENAAEEDEDNFNPDEELRDYEEVARSLPVFCVSSRAYQKMSGRLQKDDDVPGFKVPEETEMPQLQAHCAKLTEAGRVQTARTFLLNSCQQLTTFSLWASDDGSGLKMTDDDKHKQGRHLEKRLSELERGLEEAVRACLNVMKKELNAQIFDKYPDLINEAIHAAPDTAQKWGAHKNEGGLCKWFTKILTARHALT